MTAVEGIVVELETSTEILAGTNNHLCAGILGSKQVLSEAELEAHELRRSILWETWHACRKKCF